MAGHLTHVLAEVRLMTVLIWVLDYNLSKYKINSVVLDCPNRYNNYVALAGKCLVMSFCMYSTV